MAEIEVKGKTVQDAIQKGLEALGCQKDKAEIKILDEGATGLFGLMGAKPATVFISAPDEFCGNKNSAADPAKAKQTIETVISEIINKMGIKLESIGSKVDADALNVEVNAGDDSSFIIGKGGQTLDSIEYISQIILNNALNVKMKVSLDCQNYRQKQNERLKVLADKAVEYVARTGKIYRFDPMSAKERKIIHMYLKDNQAVESFSEGEGALRKVGVKPAGNK